MDAAADNMVDFTGVLVGRRYRPGQKYIQLVFNTTEGLRLSLSRNLQMVRSLSIGNTYRIKGTEYAFGEKIFIKEPTATLVQSEGSFFGRHKILVLVAAAVTITCTLGFVFISKHNSVGHNQASNQSANTQTKVDTTSSDTTPPTADQEPGPSAENQPSPAAATTKKSTKVKAGVAGVQPASNPAPPSSLTDTTPSPDPTPAPAPDPTPAPAPAPAPDPNAPDPSQSG
jgi:hypothetical protein